MIKRAGEIRKIISKRIRNKLRSDSRYYLARLRLFLLLKKVGISGKTWIFFNPCSIGDVVFMCALVRAFKVKNGGEVAVIVNHNHKKIATMFSDIDFIVSLDLIKFDYEAYFRISNYTEIRMGKVFIPQAGLNKSLSQFLSIHLLDAYKLALGLGLEAKLSEPDLSIYRPNINEDNLTKNRTIILFPYAKTVLGVDELLWKRIILGLTKSGFEIVVNDEGDNEFLPKQKNILRIKKSLDDVLTPSLKCYGIISLRSGICDFLSFSDRKMVVLYPDQTSYNLFNFAHVFGKRENLLEILVDGDFDTNSISSFFQ